MGRFEKLVLAVAAVLVLATHPANAAPVDPPAVADGSVTVTVRSSAPDPDDAFGYYYLSLQPVGGGQQGFTFPGAVVDHPATVFRLIGDPVESSTAVPPGTYTLGVFVGGPGTNPGSLASRQVVVADGQDVDVEITVDDEVACFSGTVRTADGSDLPGLAVINDQPGNLGYPFFVSNPGGPVHTLSRGCGIAGTFVVEIHDLNATTLLAAQAVTLGSGDHTTLDLVIGTVPDVPVSVEGGNARVLAQSDGTAVVTVWRGETGPVTLGFPVECPGGGAPASVSLRNGDTTVAAVNEPVGSSTWTATLTTAQRTDGSLMATAACPAPDGTITAALGRLALYDPSGDLTDAVSGEPVVGATVTLHEVPGWAPRESAEDVAPQTCESNMSKAPEAPWSQPAPTGSGIVAVEGEGRFSPDANVQVTGADGRYAWDVAYGCWYVTVTADGYEPLTSPVVGVPSEVTDLDLELVPVGGPPSFSDVPEGSVFYEYVTWLASSGITSGYPDGTFRPAVAIDRGQMAAFLYRASGSPAFTPPVTSPFSDVGTGHVFYGPITWLASSGITSGYPDGTFRPAVRVDRGQMGAFLWRFAGEPAFEAPVSSPFTDVGTVHVFYGPIAWLASTGVTTGFSDGSFRPADAVNRGQMAAFLSRYDTNVAPIPPEG